MLLLAALIFRAVAIEFRSKMESPRWRGFWDRAFGIGSLLPAILLGVAFVIYCAVCLSTRNRCGTGSFPGLLNPTQFLSGC